MALTDIHGINAVRLFTDDLGSEVILDGVANQSLAINSNVVGEMTSNSPYARNKHIVGQSFESSLMTYLIDDWFDSIGVTGKAITNGSGKPGVVLFAQKFDESTAGRATGSSHRSYTIARGLIIPRRLEVGHQANAQLDYDIFVTYDGTNDPLVEASSVSLPTLPGDAKRFTLGTTQIGGVTFTGVQNMTIDFGPSVELEGGDSDIWPSQVSIKSWDMTIALTGKDASWLGSSAIPVAGLACTHANTEMFLRKRTQAGSHFVANGTAEHVKVTADGLARIGTVFDAASNSTNENALIIETEYDGTNVPITIQTAQAIT